MRFALSLLLLSAASVFGALDDRRVAWTDTNPANVGVLRYNIYDVSAPGTPVSVVDSPKVVDGAVTVSATVLPALAGRTIHVTAINGLGLESGPSNPLTLPLLTVAPIDLRLAFDFATRTITLSWSDPNVEVSEYVVRRDGAVIARTTDREIEVPMPDTGRPTFTVTAVGYWNEATSAPVTVPVLSVPIAVTDLRIVRD